MPVSTNPFTGYIKYSLLLLLASMIVSCIDENHDNCPPEPGPVVDEVTQLLYVRVSDGTTRTDVTASEELDDVMVYLFDRNEKLVDTIAYTVAMMRQGIPVDLTDRKLEGGYVSVWANVGNAVEVDPADFGDDIDDLEVRMLPHDSRADFFLCPGDIFFGYKRMAFVPVNETTEADTVWLQRKNSRLNITVRGLEGELRDEDYYFRIGTLFSAYNFEGTPILEPRQIWEEGAFNADSDYISEEPYIMIHDAPGYIYNDTNRIVVQFYKTGATRADTLVASGDRDTAGDYIKLERGKTTNVLIVLDPQTGEITLEMVVTPWDEIHQWTTW